ncbi:MAG: hypothetical protein AAFU67_07270, partial [Bacteroidota bacterium]
MKLILALVFCLFFSSVLSAQVLTMGEEINLRSDTRYHLIGKIGGKALLFQDRTSKHFVTAYDRRMQESWEKELELRGKNIRIFDVLEHDRGFHLIYMFRETGKNYLQLDTYDPASNLRDSITLVEFGYFTNTPNYELVRSQDQSKVFIALAENQQQLNCIGINLDSLQLLYNFELKPDDYYFGDNFLQAEIDDEGNGYVFLERNNFQSRRKLVYLILMVLTPT